MLQNTLLLSLCFFLTFQFNTCYFQHPSFSDSIPSEIIDIPDGYNPYSQYPTAVRQSMFPNYRQYPSFYGTPNYMSNPMPETGYFRGYSSVPVAPLPYKRSIPQNYPYFMNPAPNYMPNYNFFQGMYPRFQYPSPQFPTIPNVPTFPNVPVEIIDVDEPPKHFLSGAKPWCNPNGYCIEPSSSRNYKPVITVTQEKSSHIETNAELSKPHVSTSTIVAKPVQTTITRTFGNNPNEEPSVVIDKKQEDRFQYVTPSSKNAELEVSNIEGEIQINVEEGPEVEEKMLDAESDENDTKENDVDDEEVPNVNTWYSG